MTLVTYPLDNTDYSMEDAALFHCTRSTGVYGDEDFKCSVSGADNTLVISPGLAWMRLARFKGVAAALRIESAVKLGLPDSVYPRIDHVILQYDANRNATELMVKHGVPSSNPQPPARVESEALYEAHLYQAYREPGKAAIEVKDITDLRLDSRYCGIMADSVSKVDTSQISAQVNALIEELHEKLQQTVSEVFPDESITSPKIAPEAVCEGKIAPEAVGTAELKNLSVTEEKLAAGAVSSEKIANRAVTQDKIGTNSVGYQQLICESVKSDIIAPCAVTLAKLGDEVKEAFAPAYSSGTSDLTSGSSPLESGKLYIVYE